jgi:hypothetical protein
MAKKMRTMLKYRSFQRIAYTTDGLWLPGGVINDLDHLYEENHTRRQHTVAGGCNL